MSNLRLMEIPWLGGFGVGNMRLQCETCQLYHTYRHKTYKSVLSSINMLQALEIQALPTLGEYEVAQYHQFVIPRLKCKTKQKWQQVTRGAFWNQPIRILWHLWQVNIFRDRVDGKILCTAPHFKEIPLKDASKSETMCAISWGDVSTSYYSTGIGNISVYARQPKWPILIYYYFLSYVFTFLPFLCAIFLKLVQSYYDGPPLETTKNARVNLWGCVQNDKGTKVEIRLSLGEPYRFTAMAGLRICERILQGDVKIRGFMTPSMAFGSSFINSFEGVTEEKK